MKGVAKFAENKIELIQNRQNSRDNFANVAQWINKSLAIKAKNAIHQEKKQQMRGIESGPLIRFIYRMD